MRGPILSLMMISIISSTVRPMSIDKFLFTSATKLDAFDFFHAMPRGEVKVLQELDMMLSIDQYKLLYNDYQDEHGRKKRKAAQEEAKWTNRTVFYDIPEGSQIPDSGRSKIKEAIAEWEKYTCLRFVESSSVEARVRFKRGTMCASEVGMQGRLQELTLTSDCMTSKGTIVHEIGHSIGWYHEHQRPDRNDYIIVNLERIDPDLQPNYWKYSRGVETYGVDYDYESVMHYGSDLWNGLIQTRHPYYQEKIGQRIGLSFKDIKLANVMYNCADRCPEGLDCGDGIRLGHEYKNRSACQCWCDSGKINDPLLPCDGRKVVTESPRPITTAHKASVTSAPDEFCVDKYGTKKCGFYKTKGLCMSRVPLMRRYCSKTCGLCGAQLLADISCMDHEPGCEVMAMSGFYKDHGLRKRMSHTCQASLGLCRQPDPCAIKAMMDSPYTHGGKLGDIRDTRATAPRSVVSMETVLFATLVIPVIQVKVLLLW